MNPRWAFCWMLLVVLSGCSRTAPSGRAQDLDGNPVDPITTTGAKAIVLIFMRTNCPIANRLAPEIRQIQQNFAPRGVEFFTVYPDPDEPADAIRVHQKDYAVDCMAIRDPGHLLVKQAQASVTPEAAVFNSQRQMVYRGRINDQFVDFGKTRSEPTSHDLVNALEAILNNQPVPNPTTKAIGCFIADL